MVKTDYAGKVLSGYNQPITSAQLRDRLKRLPGYDASKTLEENAKADNWVRDPNHKEGVRPVVEHAFAELVEALNASPMAARARSLDKTADGYWHRIIERGARSFENYVISKMAQRGWSNDFLANIRNWKEWGELGKNADRYPYLKPEEEAPVVEAFDKLFDTIESKEDPESGNVALFSVPSPVEGAITPHLTSADDLRAAVQRIVANWKGDAPFVHVVQRADQLPERAKDGKGWQKAEGWFDDANGEVWLVAGNNASLPRAIQVLAHEAFGHYGVERAVGEAEWAKIVADVKALRGKDRGALSKSIREALQDAEERYGTLSANPRDDKTFAQEYIAILAERGVRTGPLERVVAAIRRFLRAIGIPVQGPTGDILLTERMLLDVVARGRRQVEQGGEATQSAPEASPAGALSEPAPLPREVLANVLKGMASLGGLFRYPKSTAKTLDKVMEEATRGELTAKLKGTAHTNFTEDESDITDAEKWEITTANGSPVYVYVEKNGNRLYIDASQAESHESRGAALYAALFQFALNTDRVFIGDPNGLSIEALMRRTEHMLSAALKHGTTRMMEPHPRQVNPLQGQWDGGPQKWAFPVKWTPGNDDANLAALAEASYNNLAYFMRGTDGEQAVYHFSDGRVLGAGGEPLSVGKLGRIASQAGAAFRNHPQPPGVERPAPAIGSATVARAILAGTVFRAATTGGAQRSSVLADYAVGRGERAASGQGVTGDGIAGQFYSLPNEKTPPQGGVSVSHMPADWTAEQQAFASKFSTFAPQETLKEKWGRVKQDMGLRLTQQVFDQFRPMLRYSKEGFMQAHLSKAIDGAIEGIFTKGIPRLREGALDIGKNNGGLQKLLSSLGGPDEATRFFMWIAANRAERLMTEGREHLFTADDIKAGKAYSQGKLADGRNRSEAYKEALREFNAFQKAVLDIAQQAGMIDAEARKGWEHEFYIPFYRATEDGGATTAGGSVNTGMARQKIIRQLKGGTENLGDPLENVLANWNVILTGSMRNMAANAALKGAATTGDARQVPVAGEGTTWTMQGGKQVHWEVDNPLLVTALESLSFTGYNNPAMKMAGKFKRMLTFGVKFSPAYRVRNLTRDLIHATAVADVSKNPLKNLVNGWKMTADDHAINVSLMFGGGAVRYGLAYDGDQAANAKRLVSMGVNDNQILDTPDKVKNAFRRLYDWYQEAWAKEQLRLDPVPPLKGMRVPDVFSNIPNNERPNRGVRGEAVMQLSDSHL